MKILQINVVCGIRSTGRICSDIASVLETNGHECKIAYGREIVPDKYQKYALRIGRDIDVKLHGVNARLFDKAGFGSNKATVKFIEWVKEYNPDVIHLHNIHGYYINVEVLFNYLRQCEKKIIWTLHDCWCFTGHCVYFDFIGCEKWREGGCHKCPQKKKYPSSYFFDNSKRNFLKKKELFTGINNMTLVTPSFWLAGLVKESFLCEYPVEVLPNGIDLNIFKPTDSNFRECNKLYNKKIVLGVASTWDERKGFQDFVKLSNLLDDQYKCVLVGLDENQIKVLPQNIIGIKRTNNMRELAEIYTAADVFVNPTYEDNYPTTNLEARACGTPVITYATGGSGESVDEDFGFVIEKGNIEELIAAINKTTKNEFLIQDSIKRTNLVDKNYLYMSYAQLYSEMRIKNEQTN